MSVVWQTVLGTSAMEHMDTYCTSTLDPLHLLQPRCSPLPPPSHLTPECCSELESGVDDSADAFAARMGW